MGNSAGQLTGGVFEETIISTAGSSTTPDVTSNFHIALEKCHLSSLDEVALDNAGFSMEPKSFSARVEERQFSSAVENEIEKSKVHWSEVRLSVSSKGRSNSSKDLSNSSEDLSNCSEDNNDYEEVDRENEKVFTELMNDPQWKHRKRGQFFSKPPRYMKLGSRIAAGGQAEIFEYLNEYGSVHPESLLKVFKRGTRLSDLRRQWPRGFMEVNICVATSAWLLSDGRFAFVMVRCWGDLRKLIDQAMKEKSNQGPPFPYEWDGFTWHAKDIMKYLAGFMYELHKKGIIHRDLKAANILLKAKDKVYYNIVADFECSNGVVGTGFWRAPEILLALKNREEIHFSEKVDVYSYGMTCFEIVTGRLPFEGELEDCRASRDLVIKGRRPTLPSDLDVTLKDLIVRCWNPSPNERPSFFDILYVFYFLETHGRFP